MRAPRSTARIARYQPPSAVAWRTVDLICRATPEVGGPGSQGAIPTTRLVSVPGGHRRGFNNLRALAQIRGETGSLETAPSATPSRRCSHSGIGLEAERVFPWISGNCQQFREARRRSEPRLRRGGGRGTGIVSQAAFRGPGWGGPRGVGGDPWDTPRGRRRRLGPRLGPSCRPRARQSLNDAQGASETDPPTMSRESWCARASRHPAYSA